MNMIHLVGITADRVGWCGPVEFHVLPCSTIMLNPLQSEIDTDSIKAKRFMHNQFIQGPEEC